MEVCHLLEQVGRWWRCGDGDAHGVRELFGFFGGTEEGIDCWCGVEVCDIFCFEEFPD